MRAILLILACSISILLGAQVSHADEKIGVILMPGTRATSGPKSTIGPLIRSLRKAGIITIAPKMPWSRGRHLAKTVEGSLREIDQAVATLKKKGATKIVVGGHSHGATAALAYGGHRKGLAGILVIAPGHLPSNIGWHSRMDYDYIRAEKLIKQGKGRVRTKFKSADTRVYTFVTTPEIYFSWYNPDGPANYRSNAEKIEPGTALFWIVGRYDRINRLGKYLAFGHAPTHSKSAYVEVDGGHLATPRVGAKQIIEWLKSL